NTRIMPAMGIEMIEVGEASGALSPMLASVAEFYEDETNQRIGTLIAIVEPAILVFMAFVIAFILISLYLPIFSSSVGAGPGSREAGLSSMVTSDYKVASSAPQDDHVERERTRRTAEPYRCPFVDLNEVRIDPEVFRSIPAELMFRFNFVPLESRENQLIVAVADPSHVLLSDELPLLLGKKLVLKVATPTQISDLLKRTEQSQRVLEQATEAFTLQVVQDEDESEEALFAERLTQEGGVSPIVRLVDTVIFTALERRASDIHIEARDLEVIVKYRIDGILVHAMPPISKEWHSTILSRIKVMSELDIAERRVPQDGRFRVRYKGRFIDFRVSIMPSIHGEDAVW